MKPNAAQYRRLLTDILASIDKSDPTYTERQILISCCLTMADTITVLEQKVAKLENTMGTAVGPALKKLLTSTTPETVEEATPETVEETPIATATVANAQPVTTQANAAVPAGNGAHLKSGGSLVTTSAPAPIPAKQAQT